MLEGDETLSEAVVRVKHVVWDNTMNLEIFVNQVEMIETAVKLYEFYKVFSAWHPGQN